MDATFSIPETAYTETEEHLAICGERGGEPEKARRWLRALAALGTVISRLVDADFEA